MALNLTEELVQGEAPKKRQKARVETFAQSERAVQENRDFFSPDDSVDDPVFLERKRPRRRVDCEGGVRPCPFVSCRYHLYLDTNPRNGHIKFNFPDVEVWELEKTCALDLVDSEERGMTLTDIGRCVNLTRERVRQVVVVVLRKIKTGVIGEMFEGEEEEND